MGHDQSSMLKTSGAVKRGRLAYLETGCSSSDLILDCFSGHIALFEFVRLQNLAHTQPEGFIGAVHETVYQMIEQESDSWMSQELIKIRAGWVGRHLLLIGFPFEVQESLAQKRFSALNKRFSSLTKVTFSEPGHNGKHEVFTGTLAPMYSSVTKPKLMSYTNLAAILINDLQRRKSTIPGRSGSGFPSALWTENPLTAIAGESSSPEERAEACRENTRHLLRSIFRSRKVRLTARPIEHSVSGAWVGLSARLDGLDTLLQGSGLVRESAETLCESMGMTWELESAMLDQLLHDITRAGGMAGLLESVKVNLPVSTETLVCWASFPADLDAILTGFPVEIVRRVRLVMYHPINQRLKLTAPQMDKIGQLCAALKNRYQLEVGERRDALSQSLGQSEAMGIRSVVLEGDMITASGAGERMRAFMDYRNKVQPTWHVTLGHEASADLMRLADNLGIDAVERATHEAPELLTDTLQRMAGQGKTAPRVELIDARTRFLRMAKTANSDTENRGAKQ